MDDLAVDVEEPLEEEPLLVLGEFVGRDLGVHPVQVTDPLLEFLELEEEHRGQVEGGVHLRVLLEHGRHVHVVLGGMDPHPRARHDAVVVLGVERLVLVPQEHELERVIPLDLHLDRRRGGGDGRLGGGRGLGGS